MYLSDLDFDTALKYISGATVLIPLVAFIVYRHWLREYGLLGWYFVATAITEAAGLSTMHLPTGNVFIYSPYSLLELILFSCLYYKFAERWMKPFIFYPVALFLLVGLAVYASDIYAYSRFILAGPRVLLLGIGGLYFVQSYKDHMLGLRTVMDWVNLVSVIYFFATVGLFFYGDLLADQIPALAGWWTSRLFWNAAFHLWLTHAFWSSPYLRLSAAVSVPHG